MVETLATLTWPAAVAVLGSVVVVVTGVLALFLNYLKARSPSTNGPVALKSQLPNPEIAQLHSRISELKDRVAVLEGDQKVLNVRIENLLRQLEEHAMKDTNDFQVISQKVDKLMEIIVEMLKDDR